ncbi:hypothetical protein DVR11_22600 [Paracoccus versutus]|nr:hypothetical protein DVR11_22600 [Paracoccus versutus]
MVQVRSLLNETGLRKNDFAATEDPTPDYDERFGWEVGSRIMSGGVEWVCKDATASAAVWVPASDESAVIIATEAKATADGAVIDAETAQITATSADARATEAQQVQARRDFARWELVDYLHSDDMAAAFAGDTASQDEARVTERIRLFHDDWMSWWSASGGRGGKIVYPPVPLAVNDSVQSEDFAQMLWDMGFAFDNSRIDLEFNGVRFQCKNWIARSEIRTSGFYAANGITTPVPKAVWRWEQSTPRQLSPQMRGRLHIHGENNALTDPIGFKAMRWNTANIDRVYCRYLRNHGLFIENMFNSSVMQMEADACGYQPTDAGGDGFISETVRFSNVGAVVTATEPVFDASHGGLWFALANSGPVRSGSRQVHWSTIASVDSPTQITLTNAPDTDVSGEYGSFEAVRGSINAGSNILTLSAAVSDDLTGRYITVMRCGQEGIAASYGTLTARVLSHSGDQVTLSHNARLTVSDAPVSIAQGMFLGRSADGAVAGIGQNDDVTFDNLRLENASPRSGMLAMISDTTSVDFGPGSKFHGKPPMGNNFGANFSAIAYDWAEGVTLNSCIVAHSGHSPRFGRHMMFGGRVMVDVRGGTAADYLLGTESAEVYNDMQASPTCAQFFYSAIRQGGYVANQSLLRLGATGLASQVLGGASRRTSKRDPDGRSFPDHFGDVVIDGDLSGASFSQDGAPGRPTTFAAGKAMLAGYGALTGAVQPPLIADLNTSAQAHRRVRFNAGAANSPWAGTAGIALTIFNGTNAIQEAWSNQFNGPRRGALRHSNNAGMTWSAWTPIQTGNSGTTAQRPADPLPAEQYFDTTLGLPILWNGTAWIDYTGTAV